MKRMFVALLLAVSSLGMGSSAIAAERGTMEEAKAMVKKARAFIREQGADKAFAEISNPKGQFVDRDVYIFVYDKQLKNLAHGGNQRLIGKDLAEMRDSDGVYVNKGLLEAALKGGGTFRFKFMNPLTKMVETKIGYAEMEGDVMVGSGAYGK